MYYIYNMKKLIIILTLIVCAQISKAQFVTIPDANFVTWLQANVPSAMSGNQMDTTSLVVTTRTIIDVEDLGITNLNGIQYFDSLKTLDCGNKNLTVNPNGLTTLSILPSTLDSLICGNIGLTVLPLLPNSLKLLKCYSNQLNTLPLLPVNLFYLNCAGNQISSLPILPNNLNYLDCSGNLLTSLTNLPNTLTNFFCGGNVLSNIPTLPNSLINFSCNLNNLSAGLPILPNTIQTFNCEYSQLYNLPSLPINLKQLLCRGNHLSNLPSLPNNLEELYCDDNQLINLPSLPTTLSDLTCSNNQLISLPSLNCPLWALWCWNNQLTSLPPLPLTLNTLDCSNNNITCFDPFINLFGTINISGNPFTCLPNYNWAMDAATLNYPLCVSSNTVTNPNNCPDANGIVGFTYKDNNTNCLRDAGDLGLKNIPLQVYDNAGNFLSQTYTALNGVYQFLQNSNTYTVNIDTTGLPFMASCMYPGLDSTVTVAILDTNINFAITCKPGFDVGVQSIITNGIVFPGQNHILNINAGDASHWYNLNCASGIAGIVSFSVNGPITYVGPAAGALIPNVAGNVYSYNIADFGTINNATDFSLVFQTDVTAQAGDAICINATVTPISGDNNIANNTYSSCYTVVNSHDPNFKEVYPISVQTGFNDWLTYTIHFQNTGNAPAINIRLEDQLDAKLDPETFQLINYSHNNVIDVTGNHLTVRFPNIQLADSTSNPQGSIGFVQYRIKPKASWVTDTIKNSAEIYFDYNAPIITNTAKSYFMTTTNINDISYLNEVIGVSPNPTNNIITITSRFDFEKVDLLSITGQVLIHENVNANNLTLTTDNLSNGIYFVKVVYPNGLSTVKKVIKQ